MTTMNEVQEQLKIIYMAQMQMAKKWVQDSSKGELWPLVDELVRNLESELGMVA